MMIYGVKVQVIPGFSEVAPKPLRRELIAKKKLARKPSKNEQRYNRLMPKVVEYLKGREDNATGIRAAIHTSYVSMDCVLDDLVANGVIESYQKLIAGHARFVTYYRLPGNSIAE